MDPIQILISKRFAQVSNSFASGLKAVGLPCKVEVAVLAALNRCAKNIMRGASAVILMMDPQDPAIMMVAGLLQGAQRAFFVVTDAPGEIPDILEGRPLFRLQENFIEPSLLAALRATLAVEEPPSFGRRDALEFLRWLAEDPDRISHLNSDSFESLMHILMTGLKANFRGKAEDNSTRDFIVDFEQASEGYLRCINRPAYQKLSFDAIQSTCDAALHAGSDFAILVTTSLPTTAAERYTYHCFPSVRILDQNAIADAIRIRLKKHKKQAQGKDLFSSFLEPSGFISKGERRAASRFGLLTESNSQWPLAENVFAAHLTGQSAALGDLVMGLQEKGARVWHNAEALGFGTLCSNLQDIARAVQEAGLVVLFVGKDARPSAGEEKILRTIALELFKKRRQPVLIALGQDNIWNRLRLPKIFDGCLYLDPARSDWMSKVFDVYREASQGQGKFWNWDNRVEWDEP